jgi:DNA-binding protein H-NS
MSEQDTSVSPETSLPAYVAELNALEARRAELEAAVQEAKKSSLPVIVQNVKAYIAENGFTLDEVMPLLAPAQKRKASAKPKSKRVEGPRASFTSKKDPSKIYFRGVLPAWLKEEMVAAGFDPENKESRDKYKAEHMTCSVSPAPEVVEAAPAAAEQTA